MKFIFALILLIPAACIAEAYGSPAVIYHAAFFCPVVPLGANSYSIIPGLGYEFRVIKDAFLFSASAGGWFGSGKAVKDGADIYGIYRDEWRLPETEAKDNNASYLRGEASASIGWNFMSLFEKKQFVVLSFSALFEREEIGGRVFSKIGRYSSCVSIASEIPQIFGNTCLLSAGFGSVSFSGAQRTGVLGSYIKAGIIMEFRQAEEAEGIYRRGPEQEPAGAPDEGGAVW